jgi:small subunit ribosomal protein S20
MANNKSAKKRIKINTRNRIQNYYFKSSMKTFIKKYFYSLKEYEKLLTIESYNNVQNLLNLSYSKIDKAKKKNIIHGNTAARKKAQLIRNLKKIMTNNSHKQ